MRKIIPIVKAESLIPVGPSCQDSENPAAPCPYWSLDQLAAQTYGALRAGYCRFLRTGDWMRDGGQLSAKLKQCGVRASGDDLYPPSPTAYAKSFVVEAACSR